MIDKIHENFTLSDLAKIVRTRSNSNDSNSYTRQLLSKGRIECGKKFGEEAIEVVIAATNGSKGEIVSETADLLYHLLVLLEVSQVELEEIMQELANRTGQSGLEEKKLRNKVSNEQGKK